MPSSLVENRAGLLGSLLTLREVVKTTTVEQDPPNHKIVGGVCLHPPCLTSKDDVFIAQPPLYPAVKNYSEIQTSLFLFVW